MKIFFGGKMKKKIVAILSASLLVLTLTIELSAQSVLPFTDVTENNWYYNNLVELYSENIINGFEDGTFKGNSSLRLSKVT